jgi:D-lyxose ketol-isomerase
MKRSAINAALAWAEAMAARHKVPLPEFAAFGPEDWRAQPLDEWAETLTCETGWDVTDFGGGSFEKIGLTLFTFRSGRAGSAFTKPYAEKALFIREGQVTPCHFHFRKIEDIINRGGGDLVMRVHHATPGETLDEEREVVLSVDGRRTTLKAGGLLRLKPGQSVTLPRRVYHAFWAETAPVLGWEVSMANDDHTDNRFLTDLPRFSAIEEDEAPARILCNEYADYGLTAN